MLVVFSYYHLRPWRGRCTVMATKGGRGGASVGCQSWAGDACCGCGRAGDHGSGPTHKVGGEGGLHGTVDVHIQDYPT